MAKKYLDYDGLAYLWEKIKNKLSLKVDKVDGKGLSTNDYTTTEKTKLSGIETGAQVNVIEGVQVAGTSLTPTNKIVNIPKMGAASSSAAGTDGVVPGAAAGDQAKYLRADGTWQTPPGTTVGATELPLADGTAAVGSSAKYAREDHVHPITPTATTSADGLMSAADKAKLNGIAAGAQVNSITGVKGDAESSYRTGDVNITPANVGAVATSAVGVANGVCPLNANTKIDSTYLPSYVDDVIEAYARSGQTALSSTWLATGSASGTVITPETGKIYVLMADSGSYAANTQFRWSGSAYVKMADGGVSSITTGEIDTITAS